MNPKNSTAAYTQKGMMLLIVLVMSISFIGWLLSGVVHEFGHIFLILAFDGQIKEIQLLALVGSPHVAYQGSFCNLQQALIALGGAALTYLTGLIIWAVYPFKHSSEQVNLLAIIGLVPFVSQTLSYIFLPIIHFFGVTVKDDVITFLNYSQLPPLVVSVSALGLIVFAFTILTKRVNPIEVIQAIAAEK